MNRRSSSLVLLILSTTALVTGIYTTGTTVVFADSRVLKQETEQNANCATVGGDSTRVRFL